MFSVISFLIGLIVGWNFLPQPMWVRDLVDRAVSKFKGN